MESSAFATNSSTVLAIQEELESIKQQLREVGEILRTPRLSEAKEIALRNAQVALLQKERDLKAEIAAKVVPFPTSGILVSRFMSPEIIAIRRTLCGLFIFTPSLRLCLFFSCTVEG